jgi:hypothetical protein
MQTNDVAVEIAVFRNKYVEQHVQVKFEMTFQQLLLFNAKILEKWFVYTFEIYHQHMQDKITSTIN